MFNTTTKAFNNRGDQTNAIDRDLKTFSYLTPSFTTGPQIVAFELGSASLVNRLRVAKMGNSDLVVSNRSNESTFKHLRGEREVDFRGAHWLNLSQ